MQLVSSGFNADHRTRHLSDKLLRAPGANHFLFDSWLRTVIN
jgi:hypothetical protein